jgi:hypothetical protein
MLGLSQLESSRAPALRKAILGTESQMLVMGEPQSGQKFRWTHSDELCVPKIRFSVDAGNERDKLAT